MYGIDLLFKLQNCKIICSNWLSSLELDDNLDDSSESSIDDLLSEVEQSSDTIAERSNPLLSLVRAYSYQGGPIIARFQPRDTSIVNSYLSESTFEYLIIFRMIPGFPLIVQNLVLTILKIDKLKFIISSIIGFSPLVFAFVYFGKQLNNISKLKSFTFSDIFSLEILILIFLLILLISIRIVYVKKRPSK